LRISRSEPYRRQSCYHYRALLESCKHYCSHYWLLKTDLSQFVEEQAIDRVHRLNQTQDVIVYRLTIANSVEERILELQAKKRELANAAIEGGGKAVGKLSMKDIMNLFRKDAENAGHHEDVSVASVMAGMSGGLLQQQQQQASPAKKATSSGSSFQQAALQRQRERSAFKAPPNVSPQFDAAYGRRW